MLWIAPMLAVAVLPRFGSLPKPPNEAGMTLATVPAALASGGVTNVLGTASNVAEFVSYTTQQVTDASYVLDTVCTFSGAHSNAVLSFVGLWTPDVLDYRGGNTLYTRALGLGRCFVRAQRSATDPTLVYQASLSFLTTTSAPVTKLSIQNVTLRGDSLLAEARRRVNHRLAGKPETWTSRAWFSWGNGATSNLVRNVNCWAHGIKGVSGWSPWNSEGIGQGAGVLVTPRHILGVKHMEIDVGRTIVFVGTNNQNHVRTIIASYGVTNALGRYPNDGQAPYWDLIIEMLDAEVPADVEIARLCPTNLAAKCSRLRSSSVWRQYVGADWAPSTSTSYSLPALFTCQHGVAGLRTLDLATLDGAYSGFATGKDSTWAYWNEDTAGGDSGHPLFVLVPDGSGDTGLEALLGYCISGGYWVAADRASVQGTIDALTAAHGGGSYTLVETADLSAWPDY